MTREIHASYKQFTLVFTVYVKGRQKLKVFARDLKKPYTFYIFRTATVNGKRTFELKFPVSPDKMLIGVYDPATKPKQGFLPVDKENFKVPENEMRIQKLRTYDIWQTPETKSFLKLAVEFSNNAGIYTSGKFYPSTYKSNDGKFRIDYYDQIIDKETGIAMTTPARVGHNTGLIEVSKKSFLNYTVPMRIVILLHEYSHKYLNPQIGRKISDETGADINALYIYLGNGFPDLEAHQAFLYVFKNANTDENARRYRVINDFITKFSEGKIAKAA